MMHIYKPLFIIAKMVATIYHTATLQLTGTEVVKWQQSITLPIDTLAGVPKQHVGLIETWLFRLQN